MDIGGKGRSSILPASNLMNAAALTVPLRKLCILPNLLNSAVIPLTSVACVCKKRCSNGSAPWGNNFPGWTSHAAIQCRKLTSSPRLCGGLPETSFTSLTAVHDSLPPPLLMAALLCAQDVLLFPLRLFHSIMQTPCISTAFFHKFSLSK